MGGPLSVIFFGIYVTKTKEEVVKPTNQSFYKRFVDEIISKKKKDQPDLLFENLNNHHPNIKCTIETMPQKFLDTKIIYEDSQIKAKYAEMKTKYTEMKESFLFIGHQRFQKVISGMLSTLI